MYGCDSLLCLSGVKEDGHRSPCLYLHKSNEVSFQKRVLWVLNVSLVVSWMSAGRESLDSLSDLACR